MSEATALSLEFADVGADLHSGAEPQQALERITQLAVKHLAPCVGASILMRHRGTAESVASSDPLARRADELQCELGEGPCVSSATDGEAHLLFDVHGQQRWPRYARVLASQTQIRCVLSFPLPAGDRAALNLFADEQGAFTDADVELGSVLAAHASTLLALAEAEETATNLRAALEHSRDIGIALGILMALRKVTRDDAFTLLRMTSQRTHRKLHDIALEVLETGTLPTNRRTGP